MCNNDATFLHYDDITLEIVYLQFHCILPALEEEARVKKEKETSELASFWKDYPLLIGSSPEGSRLHDTAYDEIVVKKETIPEHLEDDKDGEKKVICQTLCRFAPASFLLGFWLELKLKFMRFQSLLFGVVFYYTVQIYRVEICVL